MLETPDALGLAQSEQMRIQDQWSTFDRVQFRLQQEGFAPLSMPPYACPGYLDVETLTAHDSKTLTTEYAKYKAWRDFTSERLMYTKQILLETVNKLKKIELETRKRLRAGGIKKPTADELQEQARSDPAYDQLKLQEQENQQYELAYESELSRFSNGMTAISRSITMRGQDIEQGNRGTKIGAAPAAPGEFGG